MEGCLPSKHESLCANPSNSKKEKNSKVQVSMLEGNKTSGGPPPHLDGLYTHHPPLG
jgi:hypothetical protein